MSAAVIENLIDEALRLAAERVVTLSPFFSELIEREPALAAQALASVTTSFDEQTLKARYASFVEASDDALAECLRALRQREMIRIVFRDLTRTADLGETTAELSHLADYCVGTASLDRRMRCASSRDNRVTGHG